MEESGKESAEKEEGRQRTSLQASVKVNGKYTLGYARKVEGTERTEPTKLKMTVIKRGPLGYTWPPNQHERKDPSQEGRSGVNIQMK